MRFDSSLVTKNFNMKEKLTVKEALHNLKKIFEGVDDCCEASMDKPCVLEHLQIIEKYLKQVDEKESNIWCEGATNGFLLLCIVRPLF